MGVPPRYPGYTVTPWNRAVVQCHSAVVSALCHSNLYA